MQSVSCSPVPTHRSWPRGQLGSPRLHAEPGSIPPLPPTFPSCHFRPEADKQRASHTWPNPPVCSYFKARGAPRRCSSHHLGPLEQPVSADNSPEQQHLAVLYPLHNSSGTPTPGDPIETCPSSPWRLPIPAAPPLAVVAVSAQPRLHPRYSLRTPYRCAKGRERRPAVKVQLNYRDM